MADLIVVLDGAKLVEVGTHDELMAAKGQYSELYGIQAEAYKERGCGCDLDAPASGDRRVF